MYAAKGYSPVLQSLPKASSPNCISTQQISQASTSSESELLLQPVEIVHEDYMFRYCKENCATSRKRELLFHHFKKCGLFVGF